MGLLMLSLSGDSELLPQDIEMLANPKVGGVILFSRNYKNGSALRQLTAAIRRAANRPLVIAADHEGGRVQRFRDNGFTHVPPMAAVVQAAGDNPQYAAQLVQAAAVILAAELRAHGLDMTFAPVLDIDYGVSDIIGDRAFADNADSVAMLGLAFAAGLAQAGMPSCAKHFPGHGYVAADSHHELPIDNRTLQQLRASDLKPFCRFAAAEEPLLMTAHIIYSEIDAQPVTFSSRWLKDILRKEIGYKGLVVSDDLCMQGAVVTGDIGTRMQAAVQAGCDLLLVCQPQDNQAALAAALPPTDNHGGWQQLLRSDTSRITTGDSAYQQAKQLLKTLL